MLINQLSVSWTGTDPPCPAVWCRLKREGRKFSLFPGHSLCPAAGWPAWCWNRKEVECKTNFPGVNSRENYIFISLNLRKPIRPNPVSSIYKQLMTNRKKEQDWRVKKLQYTLLITVWFQEIGTVSTKYKNVSVFAYIWDIWSKTGIQVIMVSGNLLVYSWYLNFLLILYFSKELHSNNDQPKFGLVCTKVPGSGSSCRGKGLMLCWECFSCALMYTWKVSVLQLL